MGCGENEGSTLRSALLVPRSYFPPLCSYEFRSSACPPSSSHQLRSSKVLFSLRPLPPPLAAAAAASVSSFCLVGCRQAQRHEKKESGIGPLSSHPVSTSLSRSFSFSFLVCRSLLHRHLLLLLSLPLLFLVLAAARWFVNAKFKLSRATLLHEPLCDANEGTNTSTLSKSPREPPPSLQTPKRAYQ